MKIWPRKPNPAAAARIASHGVRLIHDVPRPAREWRVSRFRDMEAAAAEEALTAHVWAAGMSPAEYLETLVDRVQARTEETSDE